MSFPQSVQMSTRKPKDGITPTAGIPPLTPKHKNLGYLADVYFFCPTFILVKEVFNWLINFLKPF